MIEKLISETQTKTTAVGSGTLRTIGNAIIETKEMPGDIVELGCFRGQTTRFICEVLKIIERQKTVHVFDSFCGLPPKDDADAGSTLPLPEGGCYATYEDYLMAFEGVDYELPTAHKGWFEDTLPQELPDQICVAFLDSDRYASMKLSIESVLPRMVSGGVIVMHDYIVCPGAKQAIDEHLSEYASYQASGNLFTAKM